MSKEIPYLKMHCSPDLRPLPQDLCCPSPTDFPKLYRRANNTSTPHSNYLICHMA
jgi:hypothetical protein